MTINIADNNPRVSYSVNAGVTQTSFAVPFEFFDETDVLVYIDSTLKTISTDYTVSGGDGTTGTITMSVTGPATVALVRDVTIERSTDFPTAGPFSVQSLNVELDKQIAIDADISDQIDRAVRSPIEEFTTMTLPDAATRADKLLKFDTAGNVAVESASALVGGAVVGANFTNNTFTGDGSQTAFTTTVQAGSKNNAQVYIDGVYQLKSSFSVSGLTLTFTEAPPLNSQIEVIIGNAIDTLDADSGNINYNQGGTGAQTRTVENKLQDVISVKDFGAVGDGVADDTAACQAALDIVNSSGGVVHFPQGYYKLTSTLRIPITANNVMVIGSAQTVITPYMNDYCFTVSDNTTTNDRSERIVFEKIFINGLGPTDATYPDAGGILCYAVIGLTLRDVQIFNVAGNAFVGNKSAASGSAYFNIARFENCSFRFIGKKAFSIGEAYAADDVSIFGCIFNRCGQANPTRTTSEGGVHIEAQSLSINGLEISGIEQYYNALTIRKAVGNISGIHFEDNCENQAGSADMFLDTDCKGLVIVGSEHSCGIATAAKTGIKTTSKNTVIMNAIMAGGPLGVLDYIVDLSNSENSMVFNATQTTGYEPAIGYVKWNTPAEAAFVIANGAMKEPESFVSSTKTVALSGSTVNTTTEEITITAHGFLEGDNVYISGAGTPPTGVVAGQNYYVNRIDADKIKLKAYEGGSVINLTGTGSGSIDFNRVQFASTYDLKWNGGSDIYINIPAKLASNTFTGGSPKVLITPKNAAAATAMGSSKCPYFNSAIFDTNTTAIRITTADATTVGTSTEWVVKINYC